MPTPAEVREFNRRVTALVRSASAAERTDLGRVLAQISAAQADLRVIVANGDTLGVQLVNVKRRLTALEESVGRMLADIIPAAAGRGIGIMDAGYATLDVVLPSSSVDLTTARVAGARVAVAKHIADIEARTAAVLTRLAGIDPPTMAEALASVGTKLRGSTVFGAPSAYTAGIVRATIGDVTASAIATRAADGATAGAPSTLKRWVHGPSRESRPEHVNAAARYAAGIPWGQKFEVGSYRVPWPRGDGLPGAHRFGCKCQLAPVLEE